MEETEKGEQAAQVVQAADHHLSVHRPLGQLIGVLQVGRVEMVETVEMLEMAHGPSPVPLPIKARLQWEVAMEVPDPVEERE